MHHDTITGESVVEGGKTFLLMSTGSKKTSQNDHYILADSCLVPNDIEIKPKPPSNLDRIVSGNLK